MKKNKNLARELYILIVMTSMVVCFLGIYMWLTDYDKYFAQKSFAHTHIYYKQASTAATTDIKYKQNLIKVYMKVNKGAKDIKDYEGGLLFWLSDLDTVHPSYEFGIEDKDGKLIYLNERFDVDGVEGTWAGGDDILVERITKPEWTLIYKYNDKAIDEKSASAKMRPDSVKHTMVGNIIIKVLLMEVLFCFVLWIIMRKYHVTVLSHGKRKDEVESVPEKKPYSNLDRCECYDKLINDVKLKQFLTEIANSFRIKKNIGHDINIICEHEIEMKLDKKKFARAVLSILDNSIKHGFRGAKGRITIEVIDSDSRIIIAISDNGMGMDESELASVYDSFVDIDTVDDQYKSGLAYVYNYVTKELDGSVNCDSNENMGTKFSIEIPKKQ